MSRDKPCETNHVVAQEIQNEFCKSTFLKVMYLGGLARYYGNKIAFTRTRTRLGQGLGRGMLTKHSVSILDGYTMLKSRSIGNMITNNSVRFFSTGFSGKEHQMKIVEKYIRGKNMIPSDQVSNEINLFYLHLNIDDMFFESEEPESIADHIISLYGAKIQAFTQDIEKPRISLKVESQKSAIYIQNAFPGKPHPNDYERVMDKKYLDVPSSEIPFRLECYLSTEESQAPTSLRSYLIRQCEFQNPKPTEDQIGDIQAVGDKNFLFRTTKNTKALFQDVMTQVLKNNGPIVKAFDTKGGEQKRLIIGFRRRTTRQFFSSLSDGFHYYNVASARKHVDQFSNGVTIMSFYLQKTPNFKGNEDLAQIINRIMEEASLLYTLPKNPFGAFVQAGSLSVTESIYGNVGWIFAQHFLKRLGTEYKSLSAIVDMTNLTHVDALTNIKKKLRADTFTTEYILEIIETYPNLIKTLYQHFESLHNPTRATDTNTLNENSLLTLINKTVQNDNELKVFESYILFNKSVLKTNFYKTSKVALSFRMEPDILSEVEYPRPVFGLFMVVGSGFRGFHLRFKDIARGGIRIVKSRNNENFSNNLRSLLDENYGLAATQQYKNKDIPESGSKGTVLLDIDHQDKPRVSFEKYVDAIIDLLVFEEKDNIKDWYAKPEILFFGPDEGTADMMDWASQHARHRGASFWNAFTTGKSPAIGGIPHDVFGMTTRSVRQYVLGIYRKLGLIQKDVTKLQIGGPDGDLGSNEIKLSSEKTIGVVDGSGVLYDPLGIDRNELVRLANARKMVSSFNLAYLSPQGFLVGIEDNNITLPGGLVVTSGVKFRNEFHLNPLVLAEVFVPCGGRPESINLSNVSKMFTANKTPRFKYIVEGANLFITQDARLVLEKAGVILFKDASANKGGVTSSSFEVLAALSMDDVQFKTHMQVKPDHTPEFYTSYVAAVQSKIEQNANLEFEALWAEWKRTGTPISQLSDELSFAIVKLAEELQKTSLWKNEKLRKVIMNEFFPKVLVDTVGLDNLLNRIPENYTKAIFGSYLASRFVYKMGPNPSSMAFFEFMADYMEKL